jgi:uncharacterized protein (DUF2147 family)
MHRWLRSILAALTALPLVAAAAPAPSPEGDWLTEKKDGIVEVFRCWAGGEDLCGKIAWFQIDPKDPNPQGLDLRNPDPAQRGRSLCGLMFMYGFKATDPNNWEDGIVYNAQNGNSYHATMTLRPDGTLRLHGYIGISLLGASEIWTRNTQPIPACPSH